MDISTLSRVDSFPYRHKVVDVMASPAVTTSPGTTLEAAAQLMVARRVSSLLTVDESGRPTGILTERDVLRSLARDGAAVPHRTVAETMSRPVHTVAADAFVYVALARMERFRIRHLAAVDVMGRLVGIVSARTLLKLRAGSALILGDEIGAAGDVAQVGAAMGKLPALAKALLVEGVPAADIATLIAGAMRDATARCCELAAAAMRAEGISDAPAPYAMLVLGSAGRGESLLAPDQDNALVHRGGDADDDWFAELGRRTSASLDAAGIPYCRGKVMASERAWRRPLAGWRQAVEEWIMQSAPEDLLNVDIFYDFRAVAGSEGLADELRSYALARSRESPIFLQSLAGRLDSIHAPLGVFGGIRTTGGRVDLKQGGLLPLVSGARIMALAIGFKGTGTLGRLRAAAAAGLMNGADAEACEEAYEVILTRILAQQLADFDAGRAPSNRVEIAGLSRGARRRLAAALERVELVRVAVRDVLESQASQLAEAAGSNA